MPEYIVGYVFSKRENYRKKVLTMSDDKLKDLINSIENAEANIVDANDFCSDGERKCEDG